MFAGGATDEGGGFVARTPPATMLVVKASGIWRADETIGV
ncbi:hypothetical protein BOMU111920_13885 [Bordetella muralis]